MSIHINEIQVGGRYVLSVGFRDSCIVTIRRKTHASVWHDRSVAPLRAHRVTGQVLDLLPVTPEAEEREAVQQRARAVRETVNRLHNVTREWGWRGPLPRVPVEVEHHLAEALRLLTTKETP